MKIKLISPRPQDAQFWLQVRSQSSTQENNPIGILSEDKLRQQISESNSDITERKAVHRYYIQTEDQDFAGVISLKDINWESGVCEIGYLIAEKYQNKGIASQAVALILQKAFSAGIKKIKATTFVKNVASSKVLQKNGFVLEGTLAKEVLIQGLSQDMYLWAAFSASAKCADDFLVWRNGHFLLTTDKSKLQIERMHRFLSQEAYWSLGIPVTVLKKATESSLCFGLFDESKEPNPQIGYARIITDKATFAWLCDVYIEKEYRGKGLSKWLMECLMGHPDLKGLRRICLATKDAHKLYEKYGFEVTKTPSNWLEIKDNDIYKRTAEKFGVQQ